MNFSYTKDRSFITNLLFCLLSLSLILIIPISISILFSKYIKNSTILTMVSNIILAIILYLIYYKDLNHEFNLTKKNFWSNFKLSMKYYGLGLLAMIVFNFIIMILLKSVSSNEEQVREMLFNNKAISLISICVLAPFTEELIFRKSISPIVKNRCLYALICGLLFGFAHILTNIFNSQFVLTDLIYILPYGALGFSLALMDYDTKTTFTSIIVHALHNTCAAIILLSFYSGGVL